MRVATFNGFASKICAGSLDAIEPELRERAVVSALKGSSWIELIGSMVVLVVLSAWALAFARAVYGGYSTPGPIPISIAPTAFMLLVISERRGRDRVKKEFIARYKKSEKSPNQTLHGTPAKAPSSSTEPEGRRP